MKIRSFTGHSVQVLGTMDVNQSENKVIYRSFSAGAWNNGCEHVVQRQTPRSKNHGH